MASDAPACASCGYTSATLLRGTGTDGPVVAPADFDPFDAFNTSRHRKATGPIEKGRLIGGRFHLVELIGEGGMGQVWKAIHLGLERPVAVKVLRASAIADTTLARRFQREARSASRLRHPNSIQVLDFGVDEGCLYLAMELVSGRDLRQILRGEGPLHERRVAHLLAQVLDALSEAHAAQVVHRDLKPDNVMVEKGRDGSERVKVLDFGIAKILESDEESITATDIVCGTPQYMSPEQAAGAPSDARSDLYAVGVIAYQLLTGEQPITGRNALDVLRKQGSYIPPSPRTRRPDLGISPAMDAIVMKAIAKRPEHRPQSAEAFREALLAIANGTVPQPVSVPPVSPPRDTMVLLKPDMVLTEAVPRDPFAPPPTRLIDAEAPATVLLSTPSPSVKVEPASPLPPAPAPLTPPPMLPDPPPVATDPAPSRRRGGAPPNRDRPLMETPPPIDASGRALPTFHSAERIELAETPRSSGTRVRTVAGTWTPPPEPSRTLEALKQVAIWFFAALLMLGAYRWALPLETRESIQGRLAEIVGLAEPTAPPSDAPLVTP